MRYLVLVALCTCLVGCGSGRRSGPAICPEEKVVLAWLQQKHGETLEVVTWGPHDLEGKLGAEVEFRRKKGWTKFPTTLMNNVHAGDVIIRVRYKWIDKIPFRGERLCVFRKGIIGYTDDASPFPSRWSDSWLQDEIGQLRLRD